MSKKRWRDRSLASRSATPTGEGVTTKCRYGRSEDPENPLRSQLSKYAAAGPANARRATVRSQMHLSAGLRNQCSGGAALFLTKIGASAVFTTQITFAAFRTGFDIVPIACPLLAPDKRSAAGRAEFFGQIGLGVSLFHHKLARNVAALSPIRCCSVAENLS